MNDDDMWESLEVIPGMTGEDIRCWSSHWGDGGLWDDILRLGALFWDADTDEARQLSWHHLVLAVGNFKRQPGRRLRPAPLRSLPRPSTADRPVKIAVPARDGTIEISMDDRSTWEALADAIPGAAVATTTTLLAALWPDYHFVFDWRVHAAANGLRIVNSQPPTPGVDGDSAAPTSETFAAYEVVRTWIEGTALRSGAEPHEVERTLYQLSQQVPDSDHRTWREYGEELMRILPQCR